MINKAKLKNLKQGLKDNWDFLSIFCGLSFMVAGVMSPNFTSPLYNLRKIPESPPKVQRLCQLEKEVNYYSIRAIDFLHNQEEVIKKNKQRLDEYNLLISDPNLIKEKNEFKNKYDNAIGKSMALMISLSLIGGLPFAAGYCSILMDRDKYGEKKKRKLN